MDRKPPGGTNPCCGALAALGSSKVNEQYDVEPDEVAVSQDTAVLDRGQYLATVGCAGCHGDDLGRMTNGDLAALFLYLQSLPVAAEKWQRSRAHDCQQHISRR